MAVTSAEIKELASELGLRAGVCEAVPAPHYSAYTDWLAGGFHAEMGWLARHAGLKRTIRSLLPEAQSVIAVAQDYYTPVQPNGISRYALGRDYHKVLRGKLRRLETFIRSKSPDAKCRICVDSAPVLERDYAWLAGLGWFGKNSCLIDSRRGSWFFIGLVATSEVLEPDEPAVGACGTCRACIDACPTGAILTQSNGIPRVDSRKCISYLTIEHPGDFTPEQEESLAGWVFGCDVCQEVCPFNQPRPHHPLRSPETTEPDFAPRAQNVSPDLDQLQNGDPGWFVAQYAGSALMRAGHRRMARNVRANLKGRRPQGAT